MEDNFGSVETPSPSNKKKLWIIVAIVAGVLLLIGAVGYSSLLGARFAPGLSFKILGPDTLVAGEHVVVSWDTSPENQQQFPSEKIEFCRGRFFGESCVTLNPDTTNDGEALVFVPASVQPGRGYLRLSAREQPQGRLLGPRASASRPVEVVASSGGGVIAPSAHRGKILSFLGATGPRIGVSQAGTYRVILPQPHAAKKIELCERSGISESCQVLAVSASGDQATISIPGQYPQGKAYIKVSERGADGQLTGKVFYRRAVSITEPRRTAQGSNEEDRGNGGGNSSGGGGSSGRGDSGSRGNERRPRAIFILPAMSDEVTEGEALDVRVQLTDSTSSTLTCQQWKLNGVLLTSANWLGGHSPDLSAEPCID